MKFFLLLFLAAGAGSGPEYAVNGDLRYPADYREWVFLSSGSGMTYGPAAAAAREGAPLFDNVFVNPSSYRAFLKTGKWKDGTQFVLEIRHSESHGSINKSGNFQTGLAGFEVELKEQGQWKFYGFGQETVV